MNLPRLKADDTDSILMQATDPLGVPADLSDADLELVAQRTRSSAPVGLTITVVDAALGTFTWDRQSGELAPGCWRIELHATRGEDRKSFPSNTYDSDDDFYNVDVVAGIPGVTP